MNQRIGTYVTQKVPGESYKAYIPPPLPPQPPIALTAELVNGLEQATAALSEFNGMCHAIPNHALFLYMYVRKEALLSSQIEGTQSSLSDLMLFEQQQSPTVGIDDVEEVVNYTKAIRHGLARLREGFPLCLRLLREMHAILLSGTRGAQQQPGDFRQTQNWIGGTRPGNAVFVPPPPSELADCLANLEQFFHDQQQPVLIKTAIAHVQFETIHPFLDGNGRLGRLLIILLLIEGRLLTEPVLYLSLYLKQQRAQYYALLQDVRDHGTWEAWIEFFLQGIKQTSQQALVTAQQINQLVNSDREKIIELSGRARFSCLNVLDYLTQLPQVVPTTIAKALAVSVPTARNTLNYLVELGIVAETTGKQRDKIYVYQRYLDLLNGGTEPLLK